MNPCPKHPENSYLTNFHMSTNLARTASVHETRTGFGSPPPCECGWRYMSQQKLEHAHHQVKTHPIEKLPAPLSEPIKKTASELAEVKSPMVVVAFRNHHSAVKNRLIALRRALSDNQINQSQPTSTKV